MHTLLSVIGTFLVEQAHAANSAFWGDYCSAFGTYCGDGRYFIIHLSDRIATMIFGVIGGGSVAAVIYAGVKLTISGEQGKEEAKKIVTYALAGLVLAIMGSAIVRYVESLVQALG
ncbi:MAG: hypothetical protein PHI23_00240 [Candidatus Peribacteraceae bacterium]|nr:hypothetical protein [Candidatus Peribacteraceae bacterium]